MIHALRARQNAFTLIEIMIAVSIIILLIVIPFLFFSQVQASSRDEKRRADASNISQALEDYKNQFGRYPDDLNDLVTQGILAELPTDPLDGQAVPGEDEVFFGYAGNYSSLAGGQSYQLTVPMETTSAGGAGGSQEYLVINPNGPGTTVDPFPTNILSTVPTRTPTPSITGYLSPTNTPPISNTPTHTLTPTHTPTPSLSLTPSLTLTPTNTPTRTPTPTLSPYPNTFYKNVTGVGERYMYAHERINGELVLVGYRSGGIYYITRLNQNTGNVLATSPAYDTDYWYIPHIVERTNDYFGFITGGQFNAGVTFNKTTGAATSHQLYDLEEADGRVAFKTHADRTADGGYVVAGAVYDEAWGLVGPSYYPTTPAFQFSKFNASGSQTSRFLITRDDTAQAGFSESYLIPTADGGYFVAFCYGYCYSGTVHILKVTSTGSVTFAKVLSGRANAGIRDVMEVPSAQGGGYILASMQSIENGAGSADDQTFVHLTRISTTGSVSWIRSLEIEGGNNQLHVEPAIDGSGFYYGVSPSTYVVLLGKMNYSGTNQWWKSYRAPGGAPSLYGISVLEQLSDGGLLVSSGGAAWTGTLMKLDSTGNLYSCSSLVTITTPPSWDMYNGSWYTYSPAGFSTTSTYTPANYTYKSRVATKYGVTPTGAVPQTTPVAFTANSCVSP